ncbi:MAG: hypothetical protein MJB14_13010 [Spirochaetes bacterium]|nr:hypothetical protein [Spirochaetota bacterium]
MIIDYKPQTRGYLDITFGPKWDYIPLTRIYVENFLLLNMTSKENIHKIEIAASELLENAVKFSDQDGIRLILDKQQNLIDLSVFNHCGDKAAQNVKDLINEMNQNDPFEYYVKKMKESIRDKSHSAGLGLARIYSEGKARLSAEYDGDSQILEINAKIQFGDTQ